MKSRSLQSPRFSAINSAVPKWPRFVRNLAAILVVAVAFPARAADTTGLVITAEETALVDAQIAAVDDYIAKYPDSLPGGRRSGRTMRALGCGYGRSTLTTVGVVGWFRLRRAISMTDAA